MSMYSGAAEADLFELSPDPAALLAPDGSPMKANAAFRAAFRGPIAAKRAPWGRVEPPPFDADGERRFEAAAPDGRRFEWRERLLPDGSRLAVARDVSERVKAADEAARAKTVLFATMTHELRTPLNGILGMAGLLEQAEMKPGHAEYVSAIRRSGEHLLDLITEILDYSRLEAGRIHLEQAPFDPEMLAQSVAELLSPRAREKGLELCVVVKPNTPSRAKGDEGRIRQILFNLAGNAVKFTETGGVVIEVGPAPTGGDARPRLRFAVRDTGPGVAADKQAVIFEEFQQADAETARRYGGAGLGLAIVKRLAAVMGGTVGVESLPGAGSTFWAEIPVDPASGGLPQPRIAGTRVAALTSSPVLLRMLKETVEGLGGRLVHGGPKGPLTAPVDVVFVDHEPKAIDLRIEAAGSAPVIVLVPQEEREALAAYGLRGVGHYLLKPLRRRSVAERLHLAVHRPNAGATSRLLAQDDRTTAPPRLGLKVLLAEDNSVNALLARTILARWGCTVDVVSDGDQAFQAARANRYDAIVLDLRMPVLDGYGAAKLIRGLPGPAGRTPILALTADAGESERAAALSAGMDDFVVKPLEPQQLVAALQRLRGFDKADKLAVAKE